MRGVSEGTPGEARHRRWARIALAAVLLLALWFRLPGLAEDPASFRDELSYVPKAVRYGGGDLNPHYFHNPPLASYLMFGAIGADYAVARATGTVASALEYKARYLVEPESAFLAARLMALLAGMVSLLHVGRLVRVIAGTDAPAVRWMGVAAVAGAALSPLHAEKSAQATNEIFAVLAMQFAVHAAVIAARRPTWRAALAAGAMTGIATGTKYTCVAAAAGAATAFLCASDLRWKDRLVRLTGAGLACIAAFLVVCPWAVLDAETFRAHVANQAGLIDRSGGDDALSRYAGSLLDEGLGTFGAPVAGLGIALAIRLAAMGRHDIRARIATAAAGPVSLAILLLSHPTLAYGRYLLPALPCVLAFACAAIAATWTSEPRLVGAAGGARSFFRFAPPAAVTIACALLVAGGAKARSVSGVPSSRAETSAWMRASVPDGAIVLTDLSAPWLFDIRLRAEFEGRVRPEIAAKLRPAWTLVRVYDYFQDPPAKIPGTEIRADDFAAIRAMPERVFALVSDDARDVFGKLPPADYPCARWHAAVREAGPTVHEPIEGLRGPRYRLIELNPR
ncbi:MAG: hypothetical protein HMLKMBBP_00515 [Planctomycetes bacterium]|nr:hypothetical protein [Planctomycetota bacterium]